MICRGVLFVEVGKVGDVTVKGLVREGSFWWGKWFVVVVGSGGGGRRT